MQGKTLVHFCIEYGGIIIPVRFLLSMSGKFLHFFPKDKIGSEEKFLQSPELVLEVFLSSSGDNPKVGIFFFSW